MNLEKIFSEVLSLSLTGSITICIILVFKSLFRNRFSGTWHYYVWVLLFLQLMVPYTPNALISRAGLKNATPQANINTSIGLGSKGATAVSPGSPYEQTTETIGNGVNLPKPDPVPEAAANPDKMGKINGRLLGCIWIAGVCVFLLYAGAADLWLHRKVCSRRRNIDAAYRELLEECKMKLGIHAPIELYTIEKIDTPCVIGIFRTKLLIPAALIQKLSQEEARFMLLHELVHAKRKDLLIRWIMLLLQALHWFNPLVWIAFHKAKNDCELACDAKVLRCICPEEHRMYGQTIINIAKMVHSVWPMTAAAGMAGKSQVKRRIVMITRFKQTSWVRSMAAAVSILLIGSAALLAGCAVKENKNLQSLKTDITTDATNTGTGIPDTRSNASRNSNQNPNQITSRNTNQDEIMNRFKELLSAGPETTAVINFVNENIGKVSKENSTLFLTGIEEAQRKMLPKLEEKYFQGSTIQSSLSKVYKPGFDLGSLDGITDKELKELLVQTRENGFKVETAEGSYFPIIDYSFYVRYNTYMAPDIKDYFTLMTVESNQVPAKDAALVIRWDEVISRALNQEKFIETYGNSVKLSDVKALYNKYRTFVFYGLNNTPLFDYETKAVSADAKASYMNAVNKVGNSKLLAALKDFMDVLARNNYKMTSEVEKFRENIAGSY